MCLSVSIFNGNQTYGDCYLTIWMDLNLIIYGSLRKNSVNLANQKQANRLLFLFHLLGQTTKRGTKVGHY